MNQYAYIFMLYGWLRSLSVSVPRKLPCQSFYHIYFVLSDDQTIQTSQMYFYPLAFFALIFVDKASQQLLLTLKPLTLSFLSIWFLILVLRPIQISSKLLQMLYSVEVSIQKWMWSPLNKLGTKREPLVQYICFHVALKKDFEPARCLFNVVQETQGL